MGGRRSACLSSSTFVQCGWSPAYTCPVSAVFHTLSIGLWILITIFFLKMKAPRRKCQFLFTRLLSLLMLDVNLYYQRICHKFYTHLLFSLTARLASQRAKYIKDKMEETQCYRRALDAQVREQLLFLKLCSASITF